MRAVFERVVGPDVEVIDSGAAVARQARRVLTERKQLADLERSAATEPRALRPDDEFWCSGDVEQFESTASAILGAPVRARCV
jgi:glutamate racemase